MMRGLTSVHRWWNRRKKAGPKGIKYLPWKPWMTGECWGENVEVLRGQDVNINKDDYQTHEDLAGYTACLFPVRLPQ